MPIYEYFCPECKSKFELLRPISQAEAAGECLECGALSERTITAFACRTKGDGGEVASVAGTGSSCTSCSASTCSSCV